MILRFTAYRRKLSEVGNHTPVQANPDDKPQYEGAVFSDGTTVIKWLTPAGGTSTFENLEKALATHGHPEYGTDIIWHDGPAPEEWKHQLIAHAEHIQNGYHATGFTDVTMRIHEDEEGRLRELVLHTLDDSIFHQIYPVPGSTTVEA